ncbi:MAG: MlaD family protein [Bacteroidia bacterium]|nr:MlaD family protein [Bacteroidia bacterium]
MKLTKTSKIGILVVVCLTILIWGINFLKGRDIFRTEKVFYARYKDVGGLTATTLVTLNGLKVGYVREIYFAEDLSGDLIVKVAIHNDFPLPVGTSAEIASSDLLGSKVVKLNLGKSEMLVHANDTLATKMGADIMQQVNEQIAPLKAKAERLIENLDSIVTAASKILNSDSQHNISESIRQINLTMTNLEKISGNLNDVISDQKKNLASTISNISEITGKLNNNSGKLGHIMDNFSSFSDSLTKLELNRTINHLNGSVANLQTILSKIDTANGTLGLLVNDPRLYHNLNYTSENLNRLLVDFRMNPKRYVNFSALNLGREVYVSPSPNTQVSDSITYRVQIFSSLNPVSLTSPMFKGIEEVSEIKSGDKYYYVTAQESSYDKVIMVLNRVQSAFPEAFLRSYKDGKEISLKNVLKRVKK